MAAPGDDSPDTAGDPPACGLLRLGDDELALIAALCGRDAPVLSHLCRALSHVWRMVRTEPRMLAQLLAHVCGEAVGWWRPTYTKTPIDIMRARGAGMVAADADAVRVLLDAGVDVHAWDEEVLRLAAKRGSAATVALALQRGADVHARGDEALQWAARYGHAGIARLLLDAGADARTDDCTPLHLAVSKGHVDTARLLLERGAGPQAHMLFAACERGDDAMAQLLLGAGADVHACNEEALLVTASRGHLSTTSLLLGAGAHVHACDEAPLRLAAYAGHLTMVSLLLGAGADVHAQEEAALLAAFQRQRFGVARLLLSAGAQVRQPHSKSMFDTCIAAGSVDMLQMLLERGVEWDEAAALRDAAQAGHPGMVQFLLEQQAPGACGKKAAAAALVGAVERGRERVVAALLPLFGAADSNAMRRALLKCSTCGQAKLLPLLLQHPAVADNQACKDDALLCACFDGRAPAVKELLRAGADVHPPRYGEAALYAAAASTSLPTIKLLLAHGADPRALDGAAAEASLLPLSLPRNRQWRPAETYQKVMRLLREAGAAEQQVSELARERWWNSQWR